MSTLKHCRACGSAELSLVIDLGLQPLANNLLAPNDSVTTEPRFPLDVRVCEKCWLMQLGFTVPPVRMFADYVYFSSFSAHMLRHAAEAAARYTQEKSLGANSFVVEVASNDGYLLKNFVHRGVPCLGVEPAANIVEVARKAGVPTLCEFFGQQTAERIRAEQGPADLILGNNVFAHAPDINDFVAGIQALLAEDGWAILEFPYAVDMLQKVEFDTIYHEHIFYLNLTPLIPVFARHGLEIFDVERLEIHGGSLRISVAHAGRQRIKNEVSMTLAQERALGVDCLAFYAQFNNAAERVRAELSQFLDEQQAAGKTIAAYGASAKGSTLLNYLGRPSGHISFIADRSTYKQGKLSPGVHIPIVSSEELVARRPDFALLLVWNFAEEIIVQQQAYLAAGGVFVTPVPRLKLITQQDR
jgi:SAM-dependent methyltransferase